MKTTYSVISLLLISIVYQPRVQAQDSATLIKEAERLMESAFNMGALEELKEAHSMFVRATVDENNAFWAHYYAGVTNYYMAGLQSEKKALVNVVDQGIMHLEKAVELSDASADAYGLLGSLYGWKAGLKPMKAMRLGPLSERMLDKARELDAENPRVMLLSAIGYYNKPSMFGGDKERALEEFEQAVVLFDNKKEPTEALEPTWGHAYAYAWLGQAYMNMEQYAEAEKAFDTALSVSPGYAWVQYALLPELASAQDQSND